MIFPPEYIVIGADLSLNRPGFAILHIKNDKIEDVKTCCVDNKTVFTNKSRGQKLTEIADKLKELLVSDLPMYLIREKAINNSSFGTRSGTAARTGISEVVGVVDYISWQFKKEWAEMYPTTIKKYITGYGRSVKAEVASHLTSYVGEIEYENDDESDAVAVAVAWLIANSIIDQIRIKEAE